MEGAVIGRVDPALYAVATDTWNSKFHFQNDNTLSGFGWMKNYVNTLCINSWQVKRYIDVYSESSPIGFSSKDLSHVSDLYTAAQEIWSKDIKPLLLCNNENCFTSPPAMKIQIDAYTNFLTTVAGLARSKWTEFNLRLMSVGICLMVVSLFIHVLIIGRLDMLFGLCFPFSGNTGISFSACLAYIIVLIRACSFLSNSFICKSISA